jgi:hypothetical protein
LFGTFLIYIFYNCYFLPVYIPKWWQSVRFRTYRL